MKIGKRIFLFLICAAPFFSEGQVRANLFSDTSAISEFLDSLAAIHSFSGIIAIAKENRIIYQHCRGLANKENKTAITQQTAFNMGSITKMFTGVAIMQLVEKKKVKLTDPVIKYLPSFPLKEWAEKATIQDLLTHTSGLADFFPPDYRFENPYNLDEVIDTISRVVKATKPTAEMVYSNAGFYVLGKIIEKASGESYFKYIHKHIFNPAGMKNTVFQFDSTNKKMATGYRLDEQTGKLVSIETGGNNIGGPAGGAFSTVSDLLAFEKAFVSHKLLSAETFNNMTEMKVKGHMGMGYGLGIGVGQLPGGAKWLGHNGGAPGVAANFVWFPDSHYSLIVFINQDAQTNMSFMIRSQMFTSMLK